MLLTVTMNAAIDKRYVVENGQQGKVNRVKECAYTPGGKGINVSKQARIAGGDVLATGVVGGYAGKYIENKLAEMGIDTSFYHVEGESRSCINIWDEKSKIQTEYLEPGIQVTPKETSEFLALFDQLTDQVDLIEISGSVPRGMDERLYPKMIGMCRKKGKRVILDTSGTLLFGGIKAHPTLIKPNADEIAMLTGENPDDIHAVADSARRKCSVLPAPCLLLRL